MGPQVIVVDTNVLAYFMIDGPSTNSAERLRSTDADWRAPAAPDALAIFNFVKKSRCSSYDCHFVDPAERLRTKLVTRDGKLIEAFPAIATELQTFQGT